MRVFLLPGLLTHKDFLEVIKGCDDIEICGVLSNGNNRSLNWRKDSICLQTWTYQQLAEDSAYFERTLLHDKYEYVLSKILADPRSYYLIERLYSKGGLTSVFNNTLKIEMAVWNSLAILFHAKPDRVIGTNTAHNIEWFVNRVAELIGVDVCFTQTSPLPWRTWVVRGMDEQTPLLPAMECKDLQRAAPTEAIMSFIERRRFSYAVAMPEYERQRMERYKGRFFSIVAELKSLLSSKSPTALIWNAYSSVKKIAALRAYKFHSQKYVTPEKYVVFFLHFQPERTTLPEGYRYVQQWLAIRVLSDALPNGWCLVVREHPSTFRNVFIPSVRNTEFYDAIGALPNARLAPLEMPPFELIDRAKAVATITGTVGMESLIRGKPVIVFGAAQYRGAKGVFSVETIEDIRSAIRQIVSDFSMPTDSELVDYCSWVEKNSFPKDKRINGSIAALRWAMTC